jgi:hypothetical protein
VDVLPVASPDTWQLTDAAGECAYDVIVISRRYVFEASQPTIVRRCPKVPVLYDTVDLHFLREALDILSESGQSRRAMGGGALLPAACTRHGGGGYRYMRGSVGGCGGG